MSRELEKVSEALFEKIRSRFENISLGDDSATETSDPSKAKFFNFNYVSKDGEDFGNVTISIVDEKSLKVYFSRNISEKLNDEQRKEWYDFLHNIRYFARRNLLTFDTRDITRSNLNIKDIKNISKSDGTLTTNDIAESRMYGNTKMSFENIGSARVMIKHNESIDPNLRGIRSRKIATIYVENAEGERFKMKHNRLKGARAMARHLSEGGTPYDEIGSHISGMIDEVAGLGRFVRSMKNRTFEDSTTVDMVEAASNYYADLSNKLSKMKSGRGYGEFKESFIPSKQQLDEVDINELKEKFVKKIFDDRMMEALPYVHKAYKMQNENAQRQIDTVKKVIENRMALKLTINEGMDSYFKTVTIANTNDLVTKVLEDIASRSCDIDIARFASRWSKNFNMVNESNEKKLAVQLCTRYLKDLRNVNESIRVNEVYDYEEEREFRDDDVNEGGVWETPDSTEKLNKLEDIFSEPLMVGTDGSNAIAALEGILGDDELNNHLMSLAEINGPKADARETIRTFIHDSMPGIYDKLALDAKELGNSAIKSEPIPNEEPDTPEIEPEQQIDNGENDNPEDGNEEMPEPDESPENGEEKPTSMFEDDLGSILKLAGIR